MIQRMEGLRDLSIALEELLRTHVLLQADLQAVLKLLQENANDQLWRRAAYRAAFAFVEGTLFTMKQYALKAAAVYEVELTPEEISALSERQAQLSDRGQLKLRSWYLDTKANVRFAFPIMARCHGTTFELETGGQGWGEFVASFEARNRLTHPKSLRQLEVSDDEILMLVRTYGWFGDQIGAVSRKCLEAQQQLKQRFEEENQTYMNSLVRGFKEPAERIVHLERAERLLDEIGAQVDEEQWSDKIDAAKQGLQQLKQHFISLLTKKNQ